MELKILKNSNPANDLACSRNKAFGMIASKDPGRACFTSSLKDIKRAVIINAAPRSGSSLLFALLKKIPQFYSPSAECVPFYKLAGLSADNFGSDSIPEAPLITQELLFGLSRDILADLSVSSAMGDIFNDEKLLEQYIDDLVLRFSLQWPQVDFSYDLFSRLARDAFTAYRKAHKEFHKEGFYLELFGCLMQAYPQINPYYYDIAPALIAAKFPGLKLPCAPAHQEPMIEEAPFVLLSPAQKARAVDLAEKTLLLKSSVDAYRMPFIRSLMPQADIKIIYLTRNPAASINGLYDGWLHRGFFSYNMEPLLKKYFKGSARMHLRIAGYSDKYEWGKWWWSYDLPPGWQEYVTGKLEEVCAFQWVSANTAISGYLKASGKQYCLARYEKIIESPESRRKEISMVLDFIGADHSALNQMGLDKLPTIQATEAPRVFRWKDRRGIILPVLEEPKVSLIAKQLGYRKDNFKEWF
ncbi:MAG: hypothetical protein WC561_05000 [Candidatus Omnitrophota bacterium]